MEWSNTIIRWGCTPASASNDRAPSGAVAALARSGVGMTREVAARDHRAAGARIDGGARPLDAPPVRTREALFVPLLALGACDLRCSGASQVAIGVDGRKPVEGSAELEVKRDGKIIAEVRLPGEPGRTVEVEVERTVCDAIELELERIVLIPADPPFHDVPRERVFIRITNGADAAVRLDSGTDAAFLDERRALVTADLHSSDWFMPLELPARSAAVVQIIVPEGAGKTLRSVEVEASPAADPLTDCKVSDDLLDRPAPTETPTRAEASGDKAP